MFYIYLNEQEMQKVKSGLYFIRSGENPYRTALSTDDATEGEKWFKEWAESNLPNKQSMIELPLALYSESTRNQKIYNPERPWVIYIKEDIRGKLVSRLAFENCLDGHPVYPDDIDPVIVDDFFKLKRPERITKLKKLWKEHMTDKSDEQIKLTWFITSDDVERIEHA